MRLKPGVSDSQVDPVLGLWLGVIARHHREWTGQELVVTCLRRAESEWPSLHVVKPGELVRAVDFRRRNLDTYDASDTFSRMLARKYAEQLHVVLEPEWLSTEGLERRGGVLQVDPHVHVQMMSLEWPREI